MAPIEDNKWYSIHLYDQFEGNGIGRTVIDLNDGNGGNGTHCQYWDYPEDENDGRRYNMSWRATIADKDMNTGTVYWSFQNRAGTTWMDLNHGSKDIGTMVQGWTTNGSNAQQWELVEAKAPDGKTSCWR